MFRLALLAISLAVTLSVAPLLAADDLQYPLSIAVAENGTIYLADRNLPGVWKIEDGKRSVLYQASKNFRTPLNAVRCVALDATGQLFAGDSATRDVYRVQNDGTVQGLTQTAPATEPAEPTKDEGSPKKSKFVFGEIGIPMDIAVHSSGDLFVSDLEIHRIVQVPKGGGPLKEFAQVQAPRGLCFDTEGNLWVVSGRKLVKVSAAGEKTTVVEDGTFNFPHTVAVHPSGTAYVCDGYEKCVWKVPAGGKPEKLVGGDPFRNPVGMRLVGDTLFVADPQAKSVFRVTLDGKVEPAP